MYKKEMLKTIYSIANNFESQYENIDDRIEKFYFFNQSILLKFSLDTRLGESSCYLIDIKSETQYSLHCLFENMNSEDKDKIKVFLSEAKLFFENNKHLLEPKVLEKKILEFEITQPKSYYDHEKTMEMESGFIQKLNKHQLSEIKNAIKNKQSLTH